MSLRKLRGSPSDDSQLTHHSKRQHSDSADTNDGLMMIQTERHHGYQPSPPARPPSRHGRRRSAKPQPPSREATSYNLYQQENIGNNEMMNSEREVFSRASSVTISRPSSSLSKYRPLPPIGSRTDSDFINIAKGADENLVDSLDKLHIDGTRRSSDAIRHFPHTSDYSEQRKSEDRQLSISRKSGSRNVEKNCGRDGRMEGDISVDSSKRDQSSAVRRSDSNCKDIQDVEENRDDCQLRSPGEGQSDLSLAVKLPDGQRIQKLFSPSDPLDTVLKFAETESGLDFSGFSLIQNSPKQVFSDLSMTLSECEILGRTLLYLDKDE